MVMKYLPHGKGRCIMSSDLGTTVWAGCDGQITGATKLEVLSKAGCMTVLCRCALPTASGVPPLYSHRIIASVTAFPYILYQRLQVRLDGHFCVMHAVADRLRSICLTS